MCCREAGENETEIVRPAFSIVDSWVIVPWPIKIAVAGSAEERVEVLKLFPAVCGNNLRTVRAKVV